ncbi:MAG: hypothetical protein NW200_00480 [Hyphomonadaceae bacterium]|nr:hypothetical protein [Hyphomonadaceae bacterium]
MSEAETVELLVEQTSTLLAGVGVFFTVISVYLAGLNYVLSNESLATRCLAFFFVTVALGMILAIMYGAQMQHEGLIKRLEELRDTVGIGAAGRAALGNYTEGFRYAADEELTIDELVVYFVWCSAALTYAALVYLTFFYKWRPNATAAITIPGAVP